MTVNRVLVPPQKKPSVAIAAYEDFAPRRTERFFIVHLYLHHM